MPPEPPPNLPEDIGDALADLSRAQLEALARHAEDLADRKAESETDGNTAQPDDRPDAVPSKASITVKEINDNRYYYWQWRDGEKIRSKYKGPVDGSG